MWCLTLTDCVMQLGLRRVVGASTSLPLLQGTSASSDAQPVGAPTATGGSAAASHGPALPCTSYTLMHGGVQTRHRGASRV